VAPCKGKDYARDTRGELGEWRGQLKHDKNVRFVIGAEQGFDGLDIIKCNSSAVSPGIEFYSTLEKTCEEAVRLARR
jgi:hypothetical protein